jgi:hypothetical protein
VTRGLSTNTLPTGVTRSSANRLIEDYAANDIGVTNVVTATVLARLFLWQGADELDLLRAMPQSRSVTPARWPLDMPLTTAPRS